MATKYFQLPRKLGISYFLEALIEGSPKTYDTPPFYDNQKVSIATEKGD
jgi:hypothetical protein